MGYEPLSRLVRERLMSAAQTLRTANPSPYVGHLIDSSFSYPLGDQRYARNALTPGAAPIEPVFAAGRPRSLAFNLEPLGPDASGSDRRDTASREMRRTRRRQLRRRGTALVRLRKRGSPGYGAQRGAQLRRLLRL